jgi:hypothetical protein
MRKSIEKSPLTGNVIIAWLDPAHKYHKGADRDNKIKKGSNGIVQSATS